MTPYHEYTFTVERTKSGNTVIARRAYRGMTIEFRDTFTEEKRGAEWSKEALLCAGRLEAKIDSLERVVGEIGHELKRGHLEKNWISLAECAGAIHKMLEK